MKLESTVRRLAWGVLMAGAAGSAWSITGGTATTAFDAVGRGVQVAPHWVLTVEHYALNPGQTYANGYGSWLVAARYDAPGSGTFPANDLSLLQLASNSIFAPYLPVQGLAVPAGSFAPTDVTITSAANSGPALGYAATTIDESDLTYDPDGPGPLAPVVVNWLISNDAKVHVQGGDSGGGLFSGHVSDSSVLMGLSSALLTDDNNVPIGSAFVQPAAYRSWIDGVMAQAGTETLDWVSAVPEPQTWALWAAGLLLLAGHLPRRLSGRA